MESLFNTGIRPIVDQYLKSESEKIRNYGEYWSASSAGYCLRLNILKRLKVPCVPEIQEDLPRTTRVFESGKIFHEWAQRITRNAGLSIAQELELQDEGLMVRGHIDDLVLIPELVVEDNPERSSVPVMSPPNLILYDYKTANSQSFNYKRDEIGHYHKMQLGTYMYMIRKVPTSIPGELSLYPVEEGRILTISKDDLRMREHQLMWSPDLEKEIVGYWKTLQGYWNAKKLPACTCHNHDGGFMSKRSSKGKVYNPYFYNDTPCSLEWVSQFDEFKEFIKKGESK